MRTYPSSSINLYTNGLKIQAVQYPRIWASRKCFSSESMCHMSDTFCVWYAVIYLSMVEPKGMMHDGNQGNRCWQVSGMEQNGAEWNRMKQNKIIVIKIKEQCNIITSQQVLGMEWNGMEQGGIDNRNKDKGKRCDIITTITPPNTLQGRIRWKYKEGEQTFGVLIFGMNIWMSQAHESI